MDEKGNRGRNSKGLCDSPVVVMDAKLQHVLNTVPTMRYVFQQNIQVAT